MNRLNTYIDLGISKINRPYSKVLISAILSGVFLSFASIAMMILSSHKTNPSIAKLLSGLVFPIGLILIIMFKTELFTGNILLIIPLIDKKIKLKQMLINLLLVYLGNYLGTLLIALLITYTPLATTYQDTIFKIASNKLIIPFQEALTLGIMCNILVVSAVYLSTTSKDDTSKIILAYLPIFIFVVIGLEHSVANMYHLNISYLLKILKVLPSKTNIDIITLQNIFTKNLLPVTLGNIIGGLLISLSIYYLNKNNSNK